MLQLVYFNLVYKKKTPSATKESIFKTAYIKREERHFKSLFKFQISKYNLERFFNFTKYFYKLMYNL